MYQVKSNLKELNDLIKKVPKRVTAKVGIFDRSVAEYAAYNEYGWVQRVTWKQAEYLSGVLGHDVKTMGMKNAPIKPGYTLKNPPRPFLRATARDCAEKWRQKANERIELHGPKRLRKALQEVAKEAVADIQATINNNGTSKERFPDRSPLTLELYKNNYRFTASGKKRRRQKGAGSTSTKALVDSAKMLHAVGYELETK